MHSLRWILLASAIPALVAGQLTGPVGPITSLSSKTANKTCDITDYGAVADRKTDIGGAIASAWADCKDGGVVVIPEGDYAMSTWVTLSGGSAWTLQLDGIIYRTGKDGGNMFMIKRTSDLEIFSSTGKGAIQGNGYEFHAEGSLTGPRILRLTMVDRFSVHDIALTDSPSFHFSMDTCTNGEVYNMAIRGGDHGGLDGIDVWSDNMWIHDVMVTNKDECVTIKSPAHNILAENIYCNWSGGCAFGSLAGGTNISDIIYRNVYTVHSNQMMMVKSNGGSGTVSNVMFENFIGHSNAYSLDIDQYWSSMSTASGDGVQLDNFTIKNWKGTCEDGAQRGPVKIACADAAPCTDFTIEDFAMWTEKGSKILNTCESAYGTGACLKEESGTSKSYAKTTSTVSAAPSGYSAPTMSEDVEDSFGYTMSIPVPTIPASFYPNVEPISALANGSATKANKRASVATTPTPIIKATATPSLNMSSPSSKRPVATSSSSALPRKHHKCKHKFGKPIPTRYRKNIHAEPSHIPY